MAVDLILVNMLAPRFASAGPPEPVWKPEPNLIALWRRRYANAIRRLREAGIATVADERAEADRYIALRERWVREVATLALAMGFELEEVDPAGWKPDMHGRARQQMLDRSIPSTPIGGAPHRPF